MSAAAPALSSHTTISWPRRRTASATAWFVTPNPTSKYFAITVPRCGIARASGDAERAHLPGQAVDASVDAADAQEVGVEEAETEGREQTGQYPEADDHRVLRPARQLEVMMDRRHAEHAPPAEDTERADLDDDGQRLEHEQAADDGQEQIRARHQREPGEPGADGERTRVAHDDARRIRVPPQKTRAGAEHRGRDDRQVVGVHDPVDVFVAESPEPDDQVGDERIER